MREQSLDFLKTLVNTPSPVGHEARGQRAWLDYAGLFADETFSDAYGNCVAVLNKGGSPRLMLAGHADEPGIRQPLAQRPDQIRRVLVSAGLGGGEKYRRWTGHSSYSRSPIAEAIAWVAMWLIETRIFTSP